MELLKIIKKVDDSINSLLENDNWLIRHDLSGLCISHKLAEYLQTKFPEYNVDCEYNGNIDQEGGKKRIVVIKRQWPLQKWCMNKKLTRTGFSTEPSGEPVLVGFA